ncbi:CRISPR-associated endonuclease Cas2 [Parabacteroides pacaensis]|uniref:CRISPR-associated endonuclease Cas2 n=1 Tax=Parabacteroides pacaensis TaxID=2086575 RepID=UPI000D0F1CDB|nr:CRISPR-associated endonuclease Cas2 [Parabacteroides pacaensis]
MVRAKRLFCIVAYDIRDDKRRNKVSKILEKYGVRINFSVFECLFTDSQYIKVRSQIEIKINSEEDSLVYYPICVNCFTKIVYQPKRKQSVEVVTVV